MLKFKKTLCAFMVATLALGVFSVFGNNLKVSANAEFDFYVDAQAYIVVDAKTGQVLVEKNSNMLMYPASITKILTIALALEAKESSLEAMNEEVVMTFEAVHSLIPGASNVALMEDEVLTFADLIYATHIRSANEAAYMLAQYICEGSKDDFSALMNNKTEQLGLGGSHFTNPSGLPDKEHYTTAYDMAQITRWALTVPGFRDIFASTDYTIQATNKQPQERVLSTSNRVLIPSSSGYYPGVVGSKTGNTTDAGYTLVTVAQKNDMELICVVLKSPTRDARVNATHNLLDYCFDNYSYVSFPRENVESVSVPVFSGGEEALGEITVCPSAEEEMPNFLLHNSLTVDNINLSYSIPEKYVIGQDFEPVLNLSVAGDNFMQGAQLLCVPLKWYGLDEIFAQSNDEKGTEDSFAPLTNPVFLTVFITILLLAALMLGRALYVKYKRKKRREAKLAYVRSQMPVSSGPRPAPQRNDAIVYSHAVAQQNSKNNAGKIKKSKNRNKPAKTLYSSTSRQSAIYNMNVENSRNTVSHSQRPATGH